MTAYSWQRGSGNSHPFTVAMGAARQGRVPQPIARRSFPAPRGEINKDARRARRVNSRSIDR